MRFISVFALLSFLSFARCTEAQGMVALCSPGPRLSTPIFTDSIPGHPLTATIRVTFEQRLSDSSWIRAFAESHEARASDGKVVIVTPSHCERIRDGDPHIWQSFDLRDPAHSMLLSWDVGDEAPKLIMTMSLPSFPPLQWAGGLAPVNPNGLNQGMSMTGATMPGEVKTEEIGTRTVSGVKAHGFRTTRTIHAGEIGNEVDIKAVFEVWQSPELHIVLSTIDDDPRRGRTVMEISNLSLGEPSAAVFNMPADYALADVRPGVNSTTGTSTGSLLSSPAKR